MNENYNSDKPIINHSHDRFNRYKFAKRIAETIIKRRQDDGLTIGLYGIWGEGKTSILNMIEDELSCSEEILVVKFNPWRFKDEDTLIFNFLKNISKKLDQELETLKAKVGNFLKKYGSIGSSVLNIDLAKIGESLSDTELEDLKNRVNDFLRESNKKVVIVIDDIDRLDKQELFSLFKLIKLTGDFSKTYYILSFDDEMVASAIGERFAEGNKTSGYNFLEKIIQVPIRIPQALSKDLLNYTFEILNNILSENEIDLGDEESQSVGYLISQYILPKIKTPRLALRYGNSLAFLIPLLKGEINMSDLILFDAIKIFYPAHYELIKKSPHYFIESYDKKFSRDKDQVKVDDFKNKFQELNNSLSKKDSENVKDLLIRLFPMIKEAFGNYSMDNMVSEWTKEKRIASPKYFDRYFIYSVPKNDISDVLFDNYLETLDAKTYDLVSQETKEIFKSIEPTEYLNKIGFNEDKLGWDKRKIVVKLICDNQERFEGVKGGTFMFGLYNPKRQAAATINRMVSKHSNQLEKIEFAKLLLSEPVAFEFSKEILYWFGVGKTEDDKTFEETELKKLNKILLERALEDCDKANSNLFEKYEESIFSLLHCWHQEDSLGLKKYVSKLIKNDSNLAPEIIWVMTSEIYSSSRIEPYKVDFKDDTFKMLAKYVDIEELSDVITSKYKEEVETADAIFFDNDEGQTKINALRQFFHWKKINDIEKNDSIKSITEPS